MQTCVYITLHATQRNCILQNNAPTNTALPGFSRKRALFNIWEHGPHFHVLMWKETLVCTWKLGFHNVFSTLINANAGIKVELLLLSKNWYTHFSNFPSCFFFLVISILIAVWKDETTPLQLTQLLQSVCFMVVPLFLAEWLSFSCSLRSLMSHGVQRDNTGNCMDHFIVPSCLFSYVGLSLSLTFQRSLTLRTLWKLVIK